MKRTLYAVAASLAFASASVYAQAQSQFPQPSFNDNAPIQSAPLAASKAPTARSASNDHPPYPQGTFDGGPRGLGSVIAQPAESPTQHATLPQPSFNG